MKASLVRRFVAIAAVALSMLTTQAHAATLAFEALYDPATGNISIRPFDSDTSTPWVGTAEFALFDFNSTSGVFTGDPAIFNPSNPIPQFQGDTDNRINQSLFAAPYMTATYDTPYNLGNVAQAGLTQAFIDTDFTSGSSGSGTPGGFLYNYAGGGSNKVGTVTALAPVPEPSTIVTLAGGGLAVLTYAGRRTLRRRRRTKAC
ncbi:MAG: PEP-CTERM sorting domain-containing protein [Pirellulales bacterium]|nr:PEP-CTERM sorting domain-containing protein [Pirellulales bacterium]